MCKLTYYSNRKKIKIKPVGVFKVSSESTDTSSNLAFTRRKKKRICRLTVQVSFIFVLIALARIYCLMLVDPQKLCSAFFSFFALFTRQAMLKAILFSE